MSFEILVTHEARHTRVMVKGPATAGQLASLMQVLRVDSAGWQHDEVLLDFSGAKGAWTPGERAALAEQARRNLRGKRLTLRWAGGEPSCS